MASSDQRSNNNPNPVRNGDMIQKASQQAMRDNISRGITTFEKMQRAMRSIWAVALLLGVLIFITTIVLCPPFVVDDGTTDSIFDTAPSLTRTAIVAVLAMAGFSFLAVADSSIQADVQTQRMTPFQNKRN